MAEEAEAQSTEYLCSALCNSDGAPVTFGTDGSTETFYCGRDLGTDAIPNSDGKCGPDNGPQCQACKSLEQDPSKRWELMSRIFPQLSADYFVPALRQSGGSWNEASSLLEKLGAARMTDPFPRFPTPPAAVDSALVAGVLEVLGHVDHCTAKAALRRSGQNVETAIAYILDTPAETLAENVTEDEQGMLTYDLARLEFLTSRQQAIQEARDKPIPQALADLVNESRQQQEAPAVGMGLFGTDNPKWHPCVVKGDNQDGTVKVQWKDGGKFTKRLPLEKYREATPKFLGHAMTAAEEPTHCTICAMQFTLVCSNCSLCEGCIKESVVFRCPRMGNGAHVHHHPLTLGFRRQRKICDVEGEGCLVKRGGRGQLLTGWYCECQECDFDVCFSCIKKQTPNGFHRRFGRASTRINERSDAGDHSSNQEMESILLFSDSDSDSESDSDDNDPHLGQRPALRRPSFDRVSAERFSAAAWEGSLPEPHGGDVIVGTGLVGATIPPPQRRPVNAITNRSRNDRPATGTEVPLAKESQQALRMLANVKITTGCETQLVEDILHRAEQQLGDGRAMKMIRQAATAGDVAIAGALLLAKNYAPKATASNKRKRDGLFDDSDEDEEASIASAICFCGDALDARGAVGCLNGHGMHPDCASDLMLGGGECPTCRAPLFFPRVPGPEAKAARQNATAQVRRRQKEEEDKMEEETRQLAAEGIYSFLRNDDIVRISPNEHICAKEMMEQPSVAGWSEDLAESCGLVGRITRIVQDGEDRVVAVRVKTEELGHSYAQRNAFRCRKCRRVRRDASQKYPKCIYCNHCKNCCEADSSCPNSVHEWFWIPSLLSLVARASCAALFHPSLANKDAVTAAEAEHHILRLQEELKAVSAGRSAVKEELEKARSELKDGDVVSGISSASTEALRAVAKYLTPADYQRARHVLTLAHQWGDSKELAAKRQLVDKTVKAGDVDSAARLVRSHNASLVADSVHWADATKMNREYVVESFSEVSLLAWPETKAPKTGYKLKPSARFVSKQEWLDKRGALWLQVDEASFVDLGSNDGKVVADKSDRNLTAAMLGASVVRGPDWDNGNRDGGEGSVGTITAVTSGGKVVVNWKRANSVQEYRAGAGGKYDLIYFNVPLPPQGWLCTRTAGLLSPAVVSPGRSSLRCFCCGDGLVPSSMKTRQTFDRVRNDDNVPRGEHLLVAATLEPVEIVYVEGGRIHCSFVSVTAHLPAGANFTVAYNRQDLVYPKSGASFDDELVLVKGQLRSRRELFLICGNEVDARNAWEKAKDTKENDKYGSFPSCPKGHLLHARCYQGALLSGKSCPAKGCNEALWQPRVKVLRSDGDTCCGNSRTEDTDRAMTSATDVGQSADAARNGATASNAEEIERAGVAQELKMCPCCFSGPLFNTHCDDMTAHHGQCSVAAVGEGRCDFKASARDIASKLAQLSGTVAVADVLPKCPEHNVAIMFNGCMACGHLFTNARWSQMPKWEPNAKAMLKLDKKKREAASILAKEIRRESGMLQYERDALRMAWAGGSKDGQSDCILRCLPCSPPPFEGYIVLGCGPRCTRSHNGDGDCLVCGRGWGNHNGHTCSDGSRGEWPLPADS